MNLNKNIEMGTELTRESILYSIVIPVYNEELVISETYKRIIYVMNNIDNSDYELIFVNDGSKDKTEEIIKEICVQNSKVKLINFSRNFGHQLAVTAGMNYSKGNAIVIIDADLQDPPEIIPKMIEKYKEGYDVVYAEREKRKGETFFKIYTASLFYKILNKLAAIYIPMNTGDFRLISRTVCDSLKTLKERNRFIRGLVSWVGYKQIGIKYIRDERFAGKTKYSLKRMINFSIDGIASFSTKPLRLSIYIGFIIAIMGFLYAIYAIISKLFLHTTVSGWATIVVLMCLIGGINLIVLGIVGEYIARIYDEVKARPLYIVKETYNVESDILN